ncbi:MAG: alpha-glucan family phosphorylase [Acetivibrionales bacterium]|jgi:starch phosphorylase
MYVLGKITVTAVLPEQLSRLKDIAYNMWWSWNSEAIDLYRDIDPSAWEKSANNPVRFLQEVSRSKLLKKLDDPVFMDRYHHVVNTFDSYMSNADTWFNRTHPDKKNHMIAYFSAEFGLNEVLPIYSGGLGVLSGDHCKSASDLGIPFTAIGLFYKQGYFNQHINRDGWQETIYPDIIVSNLPLKPVLGKEGNEVLINVEFPGRMVYAKVWEVKIGRISLYLLDTDIGHNDHSDRHITARLYGGDQETRIQQEILLGIGGIKVLEALDINATVYHMNEGHSAFAGLELLRKLVQEKNLSFKAAREAVSSSMVFTTHTPVPAGNDVFPLHMIDKYFSNFWGSLGISRHEFLDLGLKVGDSQNFNMTILALTLSGWKNGVSKLHGAVTRNIFNNLWPGVPENEVPIGHITNGIHTLTWLSPDYKHLYQRYLGNGWEDRLYEKESWAKVDDIPAKEFWETHYAHKTKMIDFLRDRLREQRIKNREPMESIKEVDNMLDPGALTIGFARRFATYKRANLIFRNIERIKRILNKPDMPVQIIFAGKAHPADRPAHEVIKHINDIARQEGFVGKVVLIENYNMTIARKLIQGVDIWLNNPRRPLEASGTSGQKVCIHGIINFSILDGWWCEGYNGNNGWSIGDDSFYDNEHYQDNADSESLYNILENKIVPLYYDRNNEGIPEKWIQIMKESIKSLAYKFNTHRMVQDYTNQMYIPSMNRVEKIFSDNFELAIKLSEWHAYIEKAWPQIKIIADMGLDRPKEQKAIAGERLELYTSVYLGAIDPSNVKVQLYYGAISEGGRIENPVIKDMELTQNTDSNTYSYTASIQILDGGEYGYTFRVIPYHPDLIDPFEMALMKWAVQKY